MPFHSYLGQVAADGTATVLIQQDNALKEWDIYQVALNGPVSSGNMTAQMFINGFFICATLQGYLDTATGPPDVILSRSDIMSLVFAGGNPGDSLTVSVWYTENTAGTTADLSP